MDFINNIVINKEDIPIQFEELVEHIELKNFISLCDMFGGTLVYIPSIKSLEKTQRNKKIVSEFNGGNYKELSRKYKISEPYLRKLINEHKKK